MTKKQLEYYLTEQLSEIQIRIDDEENILTKAMLVGQKLEIEIILRRIKDKYL